MPRAAGSLRCIWLWSGCYPLSRWISEFSHGRVILDSHEDAEFVLVRAVMDERSARSSKLLYLFVARVAPSPLVDWCSALTRPTRHHGGAGLVIEVRLPREKAQLAARSCCCCCCWCWTPGCRRCCPLPGDLVAWWGFCHSPVRHRGLPGCCCAGKCSVPTKRSVLASAACAARSICCT